MAVLSKVESDLIYKSWALAADEKEKHGGAFMVRLVHLEVDASNLQLD
jgi:hypothetical protein